MKTMPQNVIDLNKGILKCVEDAEAQNVSVPECVTALLFQAASMMVSAMIDIEPPTEWADAAPYGEKWRGLYLSAASEVFNRAILVRVGKSSGNA
jgi:hypothetical protein